MIPLKNEGLYIANGEKISLMVRVVGKLPMLTIVSGISLNTFRATGQIIPMDITSPEIQDILEHPDNYTFEEPSVSCAINNADETLKGANKRIEYTEELFEIWRKKYISLKYLHKGVAYARMIAILCTEYNYSFPSAKIIVEQIEKKL